MSSWLRKSIDTLVVVGGMGACNASQDAPFIQMLTRLVNRSRRVCSVCSGAIVLAATGVLNNRRAVTHWEDCRLLAQMFPKVRVEIDPIFIKDGNIWTSAGITAGIYLALAMVTQDFGQATAIEIARSMVTYMVRPGGQSQFSPALNLQAMEKSNRFNELNDWIVKNLHRDVEGNKSEINFFDHDVQLTRNFKALKLYMSIKTFGIDAFKQAIQYNMELTEKVEALLRKSGKWEIISPATLTVINFRYNTLDTNYSEKETRYY